MWVRLKFSWVWLYFSWIRLTCLWAQIVNTTEPILWWLLLSYYLLAESPKTKCKICRLHLTFQICMCVTCGYFGFGMSTYYFAFFSRFFYKTNESQFARAAKILFCLREGKHINVSQKYNCHVVKNHSICPFICFGKGNK